MPELLPVGLTILTGESKAGTLRVRGKRNKERVAYLAAYKRRLRAIAEVAPGWMSEEILSAQQHIRDDRAVLWLSEN